LLRGATHGNDGKKEIRRNSDCISFPPPFRQPKLSARSDVSLPRRGRRWKRRKTEIRTKSNPLSVTQTFGPKERKFVGGEGEWEEAKGDGNTMESGFVSLNRLPGNPNFRDGVTKVCWAGRRMETMNDGDTMPFRFASSPASQLPHRAAKSEFPSSSAKRKTPLITQRGLIIGN